MLASAPRASSPSIESVDVDHVRTLLTGGEEFALLDVRETGAFSKGHLFFAVSAPLSHLETLLAALVPRRQVPVVLMDEGEGSGLARKGAERMAAWGYTGVLVFDGGLAAWRAAGRQVFSGVYVPSKAFGEFVEHSCGTPAIDAAEFKRWTDEGRDMVVLDSRPYSEYHLYAMPNGINCPGVELPYRAFGTVKSDKTTIVVNCAGRTRGIIGAQALVNAGIPNPVVTVTNGTAGWYLIGQPLAEGRTAIAPPPDADSLREAIEASERVAARFKVVEIDGAQLAAMRQDHGRTLFVLDVRTPEEFAAGHLPGSRSAPGGQLVQSTDHYVGVRNARLVLVDDNGVRARFTASWLLQMGWTDVLVLRSGLRGVTEALEYGDEPVLLLGDAGDAVPGISVADAARALAAGEAVVVDLDDSLRYERAHIPQARFAVRSRFAQSLRRLPPGRAVILTSGDGRFARRCAADAQAALGGPVKVLTGGTAAWRTAGLPLEAGGEHALEPYDDVWYSPYDYADRVKSMNEYLRWEVDLLEQIRTEDGVHFSCEARA